MEFPNDESILGLPAGHSKSLWTSEGRPPEGFAAPRLN